MKTAIQWQDDLRGETSIQSIIAIQCDARAPLLELIGSAIRMLEDGMPAPERTLEALRILRSVKGSSTGEG